MSPTDQSPNEHPPSLLQGRYAIQRKLGAGGMGDVYLAYDQKLDRTVAIKCVTPKQEEPDARLTARMERLHNEGHIASRLEHSAIVRVYDVFQEAGVDDGTAYIVMEYIDGPTLGNRIKTGPRLSIAQVLWLARRVAEGMREIHKHEIIHRDLKSDNILIHADGEVKISDFGIAKMPGAASLTKDGRIVGTCHAMSPEQIRGDKLTTRTDLFSFGVLLYESLTGSWPFAGDNDGETTSAILYHEPRDIHELRDDVPDALCNLIGQLLRKQSELRPANGFIEVVDVLKDIIRAQFGSEDIDHAPLITPVSTGADTLSVDDDADNLAAAAHEHAERPHGADTPLTDTDAESAGAASPTPRPRQRWRWWGAAAIVAVIAGLVAARGLLVHPSPPDKHHSTWFANIEESTEQFRIRADVERIEQLKAKYWREQPNSDQRKKLHEELETIRRRSPELPEAYRFAAEVWHHEYDTSDLDEHYQNARLILEKGRDIHPQSVAIQAGRIALEIDHGDTFKARELLAEMQEQSPNTAWLPYMKAMLEQSQGNTDEALKLLQEAYEKSPSWPILYKQTKLELSRGNLEATQRHLERLVKLAPDNRSVNGLQDYILLFTGNDNGCNKIINSYTSTSEINNCAAGLMNLKKFDEAISLLKMFQARRPNSPDLAFNLGESCKIAELLRCSSDAFKKVIFLIEGAHIEDDRKAQRMLAQQAQAHAHLGDRDEALEIIKKIQAKTYNDPRIQYGLAATYAILKDRDNAVYWIQETPPKTFSPEWFHYPWFDVVRNDPRVRERVTESKLAQ
ncbi:MAG: hypothetical protein Tsb0020_10620 [Haliangiales bacterium]